MMTVNSKLIKEIRNIIASTTKARAITQQEIEKVDAKYAALAEKEKKDLSKLLEMQNAQIAAYGKMIEADESAETETESEPEKEKQEETIQDTIFPDNNEQDESLKETSEPEESEDSGQVDEELPSDTETPEGKDDTSADDLNWDGDSNDDDKDDDDDWPSVPEEW